MNVVYRNLGGFLLSLISVAALAQNQTPAAATPTVSTSAAIGTPSVPSVLGLQQCIDIAQKNNILVRQGLLQVQSSELQYRQAKLNRYPSLNAFITQGLNFGRNINPATNQFSDQAIRSNNFQLSTSVPVFQGFQLKNQILQNESVVAATQKELAATQNDVALNVIQQYLNVLTGAEQLAIARRQVETSQIQLDRTQKLVNAGSVPEANLYEIRATLANDQLTVVNAQNSVDLAKLALLQAMNLPAGQTFEIEFINLPDPRIERYSDSPQQVFDIALTTQPQVQGADLRAESARRGVEVARAGLYPRLALNGSLSSIYSSVGLQRFVADGTIVETETGAFVNVGGLSQPVVSMRPGGQSENYSFTDQLGNNLNRSLSLNLNIPIFNSRTVRTNIISATLQQQNAKLTADNTRLQLRQQIETAYTNLLASSNRYQATEASVASLEQAFRAAESRFNAGAINPIDYNIAKARLDNARAQLVQAKYDYVFRTKILDFYQNKPLGF
ncbi:TolC family protein [Spirosoma utsteinense]|uniref:Outer membrane protein n=1 Tax=Spirosoma utsteinense TaxID=2585773 RepID=A0ABR6W1I2_9BACT|nr:TolC family protein [Spirosoma utsteinense]MBC3786593.1 outer membrane protein [Spirosoma utsteinense]MBC3789971.1 outer membrane protein [Spirosoma utsteinense]